MNFAQIEQTINMVAKKANDGSLSIDEMAGGTFTISNGGTYGSLISTPIINPPQVSQISLLRLPLHSSAIIISWQVNNMGILCLRHLSSYLIELMLMSSSIYYELLSNNVVLTFLRFMYVEMRLLFPLLTMVFFNIFLNWF